MKFYWNWSSKRGKERTENQDFAGVAHCDKFLIAVVADGVFSRPRSGELARNFVEYIVNRAASTDVVPNVEEVAGWIRDAFNELKREKQPKSSISFLVACFTPENLLYTVHAGDCRVGVAYPNDQIAWQNTVHSLATAITPLTERALRDHPARNQLTRTFSTKRFVEPEITKIDCEFLEGAILASDGFWAGLPTEEHHTALTLGWSAEGMNEDDVSRLLIRRGNNFPEREYYVRNLYEVDIKKTKT